MAGLMRFLLGSVLGMVLGLVLSRSRSVGSRRRLSLGEERSAAAARLMEKPAAAAAVADAVVELEPETESLDPVSMAEWTQEEGWPDLDEDLSDEDYSVFDWSPDDSGAPGVEPPAAFTYAATLEPVAGPEPVPEPARTAGKPPISAEELRARIEESRRRIRQELEQPFAPPVGDKGADSTAPQTVDDSVSVGSAYAAPEEDMFGPSAGGSEGGLNYDVMKARIEETRDRLKAKALEARQAAGDDSD